MAFQLSSCREAKHKSNLWAFNPFDLTVEHLGRTLDLKHKLHQKASLISHGLMLDVQN